MKETSTFTKIGGTGLAIIIGLMFYLFNANKASHYKKAATKFLVQEFNKWGNGKPSQLKNIYPLDYYGTKTEWENSKLIWYKIDKVKVTWYTHRRKYYHSQRTKYHITADVQYKLEDENGNVMLFKMKYYLNPYPNGKWYVKKAMFD